MVVQLHTCCFVCSLKTGTIIIASLCLVLSLGELLYSIGVLADPEMEVSEYLKEDEFKHPENIRFFNEEKEDTKTKEFRRVVIQIIIGTCITSIILSVLEITVDILLIIGACKKRPRLVKPWIICHVVWFAILIMLLVGYILLSRMSGSITGVGSVLVAIGIQFYLIIVVNSFHKEISANNISIPPKLV